MRNTEEIISEYSKLLSEPSENYEAFCRAIWGFIMSREEEEREQYFTVLLSKIDLSTIVEETELFEDLPLQQNNGLIQNIIGNLAKQNMSEESFYHKLWEKIQDNILFPDEDEQIYFLSCLCKSNLIPYFQLDDGISMENDEYRDRLKKMNALLKKADYIMYAPLEQKTQRASLLMDLAQQITDQRDKTVFWAYTLTAMPLKMPKDLVDELFERLKKELRKKSQEEDILSDLSLE